jgi:unsaturated chondroitin disaccharide hydrolase
MRLMPTRLPGNALAVFAVAGAVALATVALLVFTTPARATPDDFSSQARAALQRADLCLTWMDLTAGRRQFAYYTKDGDWHHSGPSGWAAGYHPGGLWSMYQWSGVSWWRDMALRRQAWIGAAPIDADSQNIGALFFPSYVRGYRLTGAAGLRTRGLQVSKAVASRYDPLVGAMLSRPGDEFNVIIDSLMKSQLLWWSAGAGGPALHAEIARNHALTIARDLVRPDGSTWHMAFYDRTTGAFTRRGRGSAYSVDSTWARGQAWAILGFAAAYRETRDPRFLELARSVSDWYLEHVPVDMVPYWDFGAPDIPSAPRDSSSAAIAASGLVDLALVDPDAERSAAYEEAARETLATLMTPAYSSAGWTSGFLTHGTYSWHMDIADRGLAYGDAFFLEALLRLRRLAPAAPALQVVWARATAGAAAAATDGDLSTGWAARGAQSLDLRLGGTREVGAIRVALFRGGDRAARLKVLVSGDGRRWRLAGQTMTSGEWGSFETLEFAPRRARWVRVSCNGTTRGPLCRISEVEVYPAL